MATIWSKAPDYILDVVRRLIDLYHEPLKEARSAIVRPYVAHWRNPRIVQERHEQGEWVFYLEAIGTPLDEQEGWNE